MVNYRSLDYAERLFHYGSGGQPTVIFFMFRFRRPVRPGQLREALGVIQSRHPLLNVLVRDGAYCDASRDLYLEFVSPGFFDDSARINQVVGTPFQHDRPLWSVYGVVDDTDHVVQLGVVMDHAVSDGFGVAVLIKEILDECRVHGSDARPFGDVTSEDGYDCPPSLLRQADRESRFYGLAKVWYLRILPLVSLVWLRRLRGKRLPAMRPISPGQDLAFPLSFFELSSASLSAIRDRCREQKVDIHNVMTAVVYEAYRQVFYEGRDRLPSLVVTLNLRRLLPKVDRLDPIASHSLVCVLPQVRPYEVIWDMARWVSDSVKSDYKQSLTFGYFLLMDMLRISPAWVALRMEWFPEFDLLVTRSAVHSGDEVPMVEDIYTVTRSADFVVSGFFTEIYGRFYISLVGHPRVNDADLTKLKEAILAICDELGRG